MPNSPSLSETPSEPAASMADKLGPQQIQHLGSYIVKPHGVHFATQADTEQILLILRRHAITQLLWIIMAFVLIILPLFVVPFLHDVFVGLKIPGTYELTIVLFWYLATFAFILTNFVLWYFNVNIVTDRRVLDIDFPSLLIQDVSGTHIEQIEDVTFRQVGVFAGVFNYGDVFVETAGPSSNIEFLQIPNPKNVARIILELMGRRER